MIRLSDEEVKKELLSLNGWSIKDGKLHKDFDFPSFSEAFAFMTRAAMEIEKMNHHPEWLNIYNKLSVKLVTHDAGGITQNDVKLAEILNSL